MRRALCCLPVALLAAVPVAAAHAAPGLNGYLAFGSNRTGSQFSDDIYVTPLDAEAVHQLTVRRADDGQPAWSPDGTRLAFKTTQFGSNQLAMMNADGTGEALLTHTFKFSEGQPSWSADQKTLIYRRTPENPLVQDGDIWALDLEAVMPDPTKPATAPVLQLAGDERYPTFSPDGTQLSFRHGEDLIEPSGDEEVYVMNADGTNVRRLTDNADFDSAAAWSPDGEWLAFEHAPGDTLTPGVEPQEKDIYVMRPDGTDVHRLTDSPGLDEGPVWAPDGTKIAFSSARDGQQEIYVMNADGSDQRRLTDNPARDESPDWQPLPFHDRGHIACGDVSLASGGASSVAALGLPCGVAKRKARRWATAADAGTPPARLAALRCSTDPRAYDLVVVQCEHKRRSIAFVWRRPD
jgi:Tol biopolymer transport system component